MRTAAWLVGISVSVLSGCMMPPPPSQRVADVARETNLAARFGRMDLALEHTADGARAHFTRRRAAWGGEVRVLDFELAGLQMKDSENATVVVDIQWMRLDEDLLRQTRVEQTWRGGVDDKGWMLVRERRLGGDVGLFGERMAQADRREPRPDAHFPTKVIR